MKNKEKNLKTEIVLWKVLFAIFVGCFLFLFFQYKHQETPKAYWFVDTNTPSFYIQCSDDISGIKIWNNNESIDLTFEEFRAVVLFSMPVDTKCFVFYKDKLWDVDKIKNLTYAEFKEQYNQNEMKGGK